MFYFTQTQEDLKDYELSREYESKYNCPWSKQEVPNKRLVIYEQQYKNNGLLQYRFRYLDEKLIDGVFESWTPQGDLVEAIDFNSPTNDIKLSYYAIHPPTRLSSRTTYFKTINHHCTVATRKIYLYECWHPTGERKDIMICKQFDDIGSCGDSDDDDGNDKILQIFLQLDEKGRNHVLPRFEECIGWKACLAISSEGKYVSVYVKLHIFKHTDRVTAKFADNTYKSRVSHAKVLEIKDRKGNEYDSCESFIFKNGKGLKYQKGKIVFAKDFDPHPHYSCGSGINLHLHRDECESWFTLI